MKYVKIEMEDGGIMKGELYPEIAPKTVENFVKLVEEGFYDGLIFHRVIPGFMIQGGCPDGTGMGGPGYCIPGEFTANGFKNDLRHESDEPGFSRFAVLYHGAGLAASRRSVRVIRQDRRRNGCS